MELKKVKDVETLVNKGVRLYLIYPKVSPSGKILCNRVYDIERVSNYRYAFDVITKPANEFIVFRKPCNWGQRTTDDIKDTDEINTKVRIFSSKEEAQKALDEEVKLLSYEAIKRIDRQLKVIERSKERLAKKEEKFLELKKQHYEISVKRFSK